MMTDRLSDSDPITLDAESARESKRAARWIIGTLSASLLGSALLLVLPAPADATIPPELPFTSRRGVGARAMGMGGAYSAVANDYHGLYYNPAGLTRLRDAEFGLAFDKRSVDANNRYLGDEESTGSDNTSLESIGFVYPYPTYRGSLAFGLSYERVSAFDLDYFRSGENDAVAFEEESIEEDGSLGAYQAGFAWELSPSVALGFTGTILAGSSDRRRTFDFEADNGIDRESTITETMTDLTAITGSIGILYRLTEQLDLGLVVRLPENFDLDGTVHDDVIRYQQSPEDTLDFIDDFNFSDDLTLPYRITGAVAYQAGGFLLSGEATYVDWKEIDYFGEIRTDDRGFAYRSTTDLRVGGEYTIPGQPLRLRAGFASQPVPYDVIAVDVFRGEARRASFDHDFRFFTFGAGLELDEAFSIDAAYMTGSFQRTGESENGATEEELQEKRLILGATFRVKT
jgi:long-subunit fatty acid transport protein